MTDATTQEPEICVVGAGPAGLALALRLADHGCEVMLIDAGGDNVDASGADLHGGEVTQSDEAADRSDQTLIGGTLYPRTHLERTRWRQPGGSAWRWAARSRPTNPFTIRMVEGMPSDFGPRPEFDIPGFPFEPEQVLRYRDASLDFLGLSGHSFDPDDYDDGRAPLDLGEHLYSKIFHFPSVLAVRDKQPALAHAHPLIDFQTGWHLQGLERQGQQITKLTFAGADGASHSVAPKRVVLAMGGVENCRQLLLAAEAGSIPNEHDLLGRYFVDHPHIRLGYLPDADISELGYYDFQQIRDSYVLRGHGITPAFAESEQLLRYSIDIVGRHALDATSVGHGLAKIKDGFRRRQPSVLARGAMSALSNPVGAVKLAKYAYADHVHHTGLGGWSDPDQRMLPIGVGSVEAMFEQRPSWDNRIRLGDGHDRYGKRQPELQWSFSSVEVEAIHRAVDVTSAAFEAAGAGPLRTMQQLGDGPIPRAGTGMHHMGGTRMHADPTQGVVDANSRFHELDNLYIAGSSVFSTSIGFANPTFTIIEMALRLADHLADAPGPSAG